MSAIDKGHEQCVPFGTLDAIFWENWCWDEKEDRTI